MKNNLLIAGVTVLIYTALMSMDVQAQRWKAAYIPYSEVGLGIGSSSYYGDLSGYRKPIRATFSMMRWSVGGMYTRNFTPRLAARASFTWARIAGDDYLYNRNDINDGIVQYVRNLHFRNDLKEFTVTGIYKFNADGHTSQHRAKVNPYFFAGIGIVAHSPEAKTPVNFEPDQPQHWVKLQPLATEGQGQPSYPKPYGLVALVIPVGFGIKYRFNERINLAAELGFRLTTTDYLDDVGNGYPDPSVLKNNLARAMSNRSSEVIAARKGDDRTADLRQFLESQGITTANPFDQLASVPGINVRGAKGVMDDGYLIGNIQIHYILNPKIKCPLIR